MAIDPAVVETTTAMMRAKHQEKKTLQEAVAREENTTHPVATTEVVDAVATKRAVVVSEVAKTDQDTTEMAEAEVAIAAVVQATMMTQKPQEEEL